MPLFEKILKILIKGNYLMENNYCIQQTVNIIYIYLQISMYHVFLKCSMKI